jgi:hypothetical protein
LQGTSGDTLGTNFNTGDTYILVTARSAGGFVNITSGATTLLRKTQIAGGSGVGVTTLIFTATSSTVILNSLGVFHTVIKVD